MTVHAIKQMAAWDYNALIESLGLQDYEALPANVQYRHFATNDHFWRPSNSEEIAGFQTTDGTKVLAFSVDHGRALLVMSYGKDAKGVYSHTHYQTSDEQGFYLEEFFDILESFHGLKPNRCSNEFVV